MHFKEVFMLSLMACVVFIYRTSAQDSNEDANIIDLVVSILNDPEFVILEEQEQNKVLREVYTFLDKVYNHTVVQRR